MSVSLQQAFLIANLIISLYSFILQTRLPSIQKLRVWKLRQQVSSDKVNTILFKVLTAINFFNPY